MLLVERMFIVHVRFHRKVSIKKGCVQIGVFFINKS